MPPGRRGRDPFRRAVLAPRIVPASVPMCRCSHAKYRGVVAGDFHPGHEYDADTARYGRCLATVCGCKVFRLEPREVA